MKKILYHLGLILPVMVIVFLCINIVNDAMMFYNHLYTKSILIAVCLLLSVNSLILKKRFFLHPACLIIFLAFAMGETALCIAAIVDPAISVFNGVFGQLTAAACCLFSGAVSVALIISDRSKA